LLLVAPHHPHFSLAFSLQQESFRDPFDIPFSTSEQRSIRASFSRSIFRSFQHAQFLTKPGAFAQTHTPTLTSSYPEAVAKAITPTLTTSYPKAVTQTHTSTLASSYPEAVAKAITPTLTSPYPEAIAKAITSSHAYPRPPNSLHQRTDPVPLPC
jgi:hypothetical protein